MNTPASRTHENSTALTRANVLVALLAAAAVALPWLFTSGYVFFTDFVWGPNPKLLISDNGLPLKAVMVFLGTFLSSSFVEKTCIFGMLLLLALAGMRLINVVVRDTRIASIVGLFFLFNPFVYDRLGYGQLYVLIGLAFFVLGTAELFDHLLNANEKYTLIRAGLWFGLALQFSPHYVFFTAIVGLAWLVAECSRDGGDRKRHVKPLIIAVLLVVVLNLNWLLTPAGAIQQVANIGLSDFTVFQTSGKDGGEALRNVLLMTGFWGKDQMRYFDLTSIGSGWAKSFLILLPLIAWGAYEGGRDPKRRALTFSLGAAFVVAAFLAVGVRLPWTNAATVWLASHLPFYSGLRETQKWVAVEVLVYGIFLAWGTQRLLQVKALTLHRSTISFFVAAVIVMQTPAMLWGMGGSMVPANYPPDWKTADAAISQNGCQGDTLILPWHMYMGFHWIGNIVANPAGAYFRCSVIQGTNMEWRGIYDSSGDVRGAAIEKWLSSEGKDGLLTDNRFNINFVALTKEVDWQKYAWLDSSPDVEVIQDSPTVKLYAVKKR